MDNLYDYPEIFKAASKLLKFSKFGAHWLRNDEIQDGGGGGGGQNPEFLSPIRNSVKQF